MSEAITHTEHHTTTGVDNRMLMMWIFLASECLFFGSLISTYLIYQGESLVGPLPGEILNFFRFPSCGIYGVCSSRALSLNQSVQFFILCTDWVARDTCWYRRALSNFIANWFNKEKWFG